LDLGIFYYPLSLVLLLGIVNCANLTDGIDGLASSVALTIGSIFLLVSSINIDVSILSSALIGGTLGFLLFNAHPARIFMGDTGSLFLGALAVCLAFSIGNPMIIILIGGVYVIEGISVILQVAVYKATQKRVFKMAPLHHHLEKCGMEESRICTLAVLVTLILSSFALLILER
jgi:phospho-N-acetylmuramoyl-pentapeptide-transferase